MDKRDSATTHRHTQKGGRNRLNKQLDGENLASFHGTKSLFNRISVCLSVTNCSTIPAIVHYTDTRKGRGGQTLLAEHNGFSNLTVAEAGADEELAKTTPEPFKMHPEPSEDHPEPLDQNLHKTILNL